MAILQAHTRSSRAHMRSRTHCAAEARGGSGATDLKWAPGQGAPGLRCRVPASAAPRFPLQLPTSLCRPASSCTASGDSPGEMPTVCRGSCETGYCQPHLRPLTFPQL